MAGLKILKQAAGGACVAVLLLTGCSVFESVQSPRVLEFECELECAECKDANLTCGAKGTGQTEDRQIKEVHTQLHGGKNQ